MKTFFGLIGAGGHGKEIMPMLRSMIESTLAGSNYELLFIVENLKTPTYINEYPVISLQAFFRLHGIKRFNITISNSKKRQRIAESCMAQGVLPFSLIAPSAILLDSNEIGEGVMISTQTIITSNVKIGRFFQVNNQCNISHDCIIGDFVTFGPGVRCNGNVTIGDHAYIGAGALIKQGKPEAPLKIGAGAFVGMGAVVIKDVEPYTTVVGNPARLMVK
ncbi:acetyltransferase [Candidatus Pseudomonas adelgestsugas]|uniref:Acetyltransferase EpsM n=1 Tax=Candidatus Pseudomonas adelgestsugas TaxID=1302376 RepID=A0ABX5R952_9PSED|nr:acetyltransferase [Candidatus Pseudomonas adelgestsugas]QAX82160.1 Putative acetyltransferase EpsM [Candidatus Pseudomonas adelgestsugas]